MSTTPTPAELTGAACLYCHAPTERVNGPTLYGRPYGGWFYRCQPCGAHVGCHPGTTAALGTVANAALRQLRQAAHQAFDPLWKARTRRGCGKAEARAKGYAWLSSRLGIAPEHTHIGLFDAAACEQVIALCRPYSLNLLSPTI